MGGGRCTQRRRKKKMMMGSEEKTCPISLPEDEITEIPSTIEEITKMPLAKENEIGLYTQARKALCQRSPYDSEDSPQGCSSSTAAVTTLPSALAQLLFKNSDSRRRHNKKSNSGTEKKTKSNSRQDKGSFWGEVEDYFRELDVDDVDRLHKVQSFGLSGNEKSLCIPKFDDVGGGKCQVITGVSPNEVDLNSGVLVKEHDEEENDKFMDVDSVGGGDTESVKEVKDDNVCSSSHVSGLEWLLGSRNKIYLTSERPSKKRKLLGGDAGLEKLLVASSADGSATLCHYCCLGDIDGLLNKLIVCSSCGMVVHQRCYGVQDDVDECWLCSWCKQKNEMQTNEKPCVLCPKSGGALKPSRKRCLGSDETSAMEFAHLFCCQWMPEVFVENIRAMEPIMNIDGIKETRKKLICYLCKVKHGACVRCSNGSCRTSFHPICAREASHRMEIWGKLGCDDVELRAFCLKHSEFQNCSSQHSRDITVPVAACFTDTNQLVASIVKSNKLKPGLQNGDKTMDHMENDASGVNKLNEDVLLQEGLLDNSNFKLPTECGVPQQSVNKDLCDSEKVVDDRLNFTMMLKKLIERRKVDVKDVAEEIGVSADLLASMLHDGQMVPDLHHKVATWLKNHAYIGSLPKTLKVKIKPVIQPKVEVGVLDDLDSVEVTESKISDFVPVKSVPPRRRTRNNVRIVKDDEMAYSVKETLLSDKVTVDEGKDNVIGEESSCSREIPSAGVHKEVLETMPSQATLADDSRKDEAEPVKASIHRLPEDGHPEQVAKPYYNTVINADMSNSISSVSFRHSPDVIKRKPCSSSYIHPLIQNRLKQMENGVLLESNAHHVYGLRHSAVSQVEASSISGDCCNHNSQLSTSGDLPKYNDTSNDQLVKASDLDLLELSPVDEVEGELIFYQHRLLSNAVARKRYSDDLIGKVVNSLQQEMDAARKREWDAVHVSQYLHELREAKKQGRKEKRHKEAQAVLAAATAAAAASSRISSLRKDNVEESLHQEEPFKVNASSERLGISSQQYPRVYETNARSAGVRGLGESKSDLFREGSESSIEHHRTCDICRRSDTILNPILVCTSCKVAVHLDCYRSARNSTGPWYCQLCEESISSGAPASYLWEKERPGFVAECGLCGGTAGAFRKSSDGQWVHAFCAEWAFESTFRRGQVNPIEGMATVPKGNDVCVVCQRKKGLCTKCSYGHCQSTFHPSCARSAGFFLNVRTSGGKLQHKAYCDKHSLEQRHKAETQRHGVEELKSLKQVRVELERLRLLCERIVKREKLKREVVLCSHDILASSRDNAVLSALTRRPFFQRDVSSDSATTTSIKGYTDGYKSGSETIQRSDDITVDSAVAGKQRIKFAVSMDNDQKTDASSASPVLLTQKPAQRGPCSGKRVPFKGSSASHNSTGHGEKRLRHNKNMETFENELVMTSDQASSKNQRLPKGYVYVPIQCLSKEEEVAQDTCSREPLDPDG